MADRRIGGAHLFGNRPNEPSCMPILAMIKERQAANEERLREEARRQEAEKRELANHLIAFRQQTLAPQFEEEAPQDLSRSVSPVQPIATVVPQHQQHPQYHQQQHFHQQQQKQQQFAKSKEHQLEDIQQAYFLSMAEIDISPVFIQELQVLHSKPQESNLTKQGFAEHIFRIASQFRQFARQHEHFRALSRADQDALLSHNSALFVFYILARYLGASQGEEQLQWLLDVNMPQNYSNTKPQKVSLAALDDRLGLFADSEGREKDAIYAQVADCTDRVMETGITLRYSGLVANLLLFNTDVGEPLENATKVHAKFIGAIDLLKHAHQQLYAELQVEPLLQMIEHLQTFGRIFNANVNWQQEQQQEEQQETWLPFVRVNLPHTKEEERFVSSTLGWYEHAFASNPADKGLMGLYLERTFSGRIPAELAGQGYRFFGDRMRDILHGIPEFQDLAATDRQALETSANCHTALALVLARLEACSSGWEQTRVLFGCPEDNSLWENMLAGVVSPAEIRRTNLIDENALSGRYTQGELDLLYKLVDQLKLFVSDDVTLKLLTAVLLLQGAPEGSGLLRVRSTHLAFLERRLAYLEGGRVRGDATATWIVDTLRELSVLTCKLEL